MSGRASGISANPSAAHGGDCQCGHPECRQLQGLGAYLDLVLETNLHLVKIDSLAAELSRLNNNTAACENCKLSQQDSMALSDLLDEFLEWKKTFNDAETTDLHESYRRLKQSSSEASVSGTASATKVLSDLTTARNLLNTLTTYEKTPVHRNRIGLERKVYEESRRLLSLGDKVLCPYLAGRLETMRDETYIGNDTSALHFSLQVRRLLTHFRTGQTKDTGTGSAPTGGAAGTSSSKDADSDVKASRT
ncbi:hypothetical protein EHS25_000755 [Saitozyma podzolica]|uniref:Uncharacterized protein n=1 Tax=Saitozyma podzolica TaxID=1890683 RepID=A0A427YX54_9TREE|nr:hypothetical protein EHS25_000755 [Saitozyma podzolica]